MESEQVHPLRIAKGSNASSPVKRASAVPRPLSEISPAEKRRNSPSWRQIPSPKKNTLTNDSSPFQSSPLESATSPRLFWQARNSENTLYGGRSGSPSPNRRSSIERLQKASRVKNSNILALEQKQEYDPTRIPQIERPLAKVQGSVFGSSFSSGDSDPFRSDSRSTLSIMSPGKMPSPLLSSASTAASSKDQTSPTKSSLSTKFKSSFDAENHTWSAQSSYSERGLPGGRTLHRHAKSVTFDAAPPQVNEYEMATPDLSSVGTNSREGSYESIDDEEDSVLYDPANIDTQDDSFDASLEDTDKTPVVGPDDWRGDSPMSYHGASPKKYEGSPMPESTPSMANSGRSIPNRSNSVNSNGEHRPLPPLPGSGHRRSRSTTSPSTSPGLSATAERMLGGQRNLPTPPPASTSKSDIQSFGNGRMSLEERLKLMMLSDDKDGKTAAEQQRERRLRRGGPRMGSPMSERASGMDAQEEDDTIADISALDNFQMPPRISRESIMRRVNGNKALERESDYNFSSPIGSPSPQHSPEHSPLKSPEQYIPLDPDVPIPSTEDSIMDETIDIDEGSVIITRNSAGEEEKIIDLYNDFNEAEEGDETHGDQTQDHFSPSMSPEQSRHKDHDTVTPRATTPAQSGITKEVAEDSPAPPFSAEFESFMHVESTQDSQDIPAPNDEESPLSQRPQTPERAMSKPEYDGSGWGEPEDEYDEPESPGSVIHHPVSEEDEPKESPAIPERLATIKASGSKLKTRVSGTPSDLAAMREARRQVSYEVPTVPPIPEKHRNRMSRDMGIELEASHDEFIERHPSFKNRSLTLDLDTGLSLDKDFERVIEGQKVAFYNCTQGALSKSNEVPTRQVSGSMVQTEYKPSFTNSMSSPQRGYLMRQNTKLVAASDKEARDDVRKARSANSSPIKERPQSWTVEPWNGQMRRGSTRKHPGPSGPVPPLPGHESNAAALNQVPEEDLNVQASAPDSGERGRLFVKVMGVKDLDLPLPRNERTWFSLTLDNGVHCVTTAWLEMARNAPIGQEFELVVPNDLEFQLTLNVKLEKPAPIIYTAGKMSKPKTSTFSKVFASPKKRKEIEMRQRAEEERFAQHQRDEQARQRNTSPSGYELLSPLAAEDGSFARSYVCLKEHESRCYGRPYMAEVACFNEWATEEESFASSVKSKRGDATIVRRAPYKIGKLELQLLFVPRPKNTTDEDMPKSMNSCVRELKAAEERLSRNWEGHLSQQGGDCPYWRRRYFKLVGAKLTAYHEATRQPRATINLANAKRLIDDRQALTEKETLGRGGRRRRSAFAEEEEGYMFVEEGFRIRFNNGEVIDFYADTAEDKDGWMKVLSDVIGRDDGGNEDDGHGPRSRAKWCEVVLKREEQLRRRSEGRLSAGRQAHSRTKSSCS